MVGGTQREPDSETDSAASSTSPGRAPLLLSDARRAWAALGFAFGCSIVIGFALGFVVDDGWLREHGLVANSVAGLGAFSIYCASYAVLSWLVVRRHEGEELRALLAATAPRDRAARLSKLLSGGGAGSWSVTAALMALALAVAVAFVPELRAEPSVLVVTGITVVSSWLLVPTTYAVQYLREDAETPGLHFPGEPTLCFANYFYLAVQITTTFSTSDVEVTTVAMRRKVTAHSLLAFVFNSVIIALVVSALLTAAPG